MLEQKKDCTGGESYPSLVGPSFLILKILCNIIICYRYANTKKCLSALKRMDVFIVFLRLLLESFLPTFCFLFFLPILVQSKIPREKIILGSQILLNIQPSSTLQVIYRLLTQGPREALSNRQCDNGHVLYLHCLYSSHCPLVTIEHLKTDLY